MQVRIFNLLSSVNMRELNPTDIDQLVSVRGMVIRSTSIIPDLRQAFFKCSNCQQVCASRHTRTCVCLVRGTECHGLTAVGLE